jgi:hypothetical protein
MDRSPLQLIEIDKGLQRLQRAAVLDPEDRQARRSFSRSKRRAVTGEELLLALEARFKHTVAKIIPKNFRYGPYLVKVGKSEVRVQEPYDGWGNKEKGEVIVRASLLDLASQVYYTLKPVRQISREFEYERQAQPVIDLVKALKTDIRSVAIKHGWQARDR